MTTQAYQEYQQIIDSNASKQAERGIQRIRISISESNESASADSISQRNMELFSAYENKKIEQVIDVSDRTKLLIDAVIDVDGIHCVSQYEYLTRDITEEIQIGRASCRERV